MGVFAQPLRMVYFRTAPSTGLEAARCKCLIYQSLIRPLENGGMRPEMRYGNCTVSARRLLGPSVSFGVFAQNPNNFKADPVF
jgi:hypothetical protein